MSVRWLSNAVLMLMLLAGCAKKDPSTDNANPPSEMSEHDAYVQDTQQRLTNLDARIDSLKAHLAIADAKAKKKMKQDIEDLGVERQKVQVKLEELRAASATAWDSLKDGFARALDSLDAKFDRTRARIH